MDPNHILISDIGRVMELTQNSARLAGTVPAGQVFVDGLGVGDVGSVVLRDRRHLAQDGMIVVVMSMSGEDGSLVSGPDMITRGFVYVKESEGLMEELRQVALEAINSVDARYSTDWSAIKGAVKGTCPTTSIRRPSAPHDPACYYGGLSRSNPAVGPFPSCFPCVSRRRPKGISGRKSKLRRGADAPRLSFFRHKLVSTDGGIIGGVAHDPSACRQGRGEKIQALAHHVGPLQAELRRHQAGGGRGVIDGPVGHRLELDTVLCVKRPPPSTVSGYWLLSTRFRITLPTAIWPSRGSPGSLPR